VYECMGLADCKPHQTLSHLPPKLCGCIVVFEIFLLTFVGFSFSQLFCVAAMLEIRAETFGQGFIGKTHLKNLF